ncbi:TMEM180 (predicted) [Pycnogonum litorale]
MDKPTNVNVCYGLLSLFTTILHNIFLLYHLDTFVSIYHIDRRSFWIGETIFLIWNSINDPLFGWLSDHGYLNSDDCTSRTTVILRRVRALSIHGPLLTLAFMSFWFQWLPVALQLGLCLCVYDSFLTMVDLHHLALLADIAISQQSRTTLNGYTSVFSAVGSLSVFASYFFWDKSNLHSFRHFCVLLAVISFVGFYYTCRLLRRCFSSADVIHKKKDDASFDSTVSRSSFNDVKKFVKQLTKHKNFFLFAIMNLLQVFHCHFNSNFFPVFLDVLLGNKLSPSTASLLLGFSFLAPHINNLYFLSLCRKHGTYAVIFYLFVSKLILSALMGGVGPDHIYLLCIFVACNRIFTEGTCKLLNLIISDLVDEDFVLHQRKQSISALIFGTSSLMAKPGQTLAPLIGMYLLSLLTGKEVFQNEDVRGFKFGKSTGEVERRACFNLLLYVPIICGFLQLVIWSQFTLRGKRLRLIKQMRESYSSNSLRCCV